MAQTVKHLPAVRETRVRSLGLEKERKWQPTPVFLPGKSHGWSLVGYSPWGCKESDTTERLHFTSSHPSFLSYIMEREGSSDTHTSMSCLEGREMELGVNMPVANWYKHIVRSLAVPSTHVSQVLRGRSAPGRSSHPVAQHCAIVFRGENILQLIIHLDST